MIRQSGASWFGWKTFRRIFAWRYLSYCTTMTPDRCFKIDAHLCVQVVMFNNPIHPSKPTFLTRRISKDVHSDCIANQPLVTEEYRFFEHTSGPLDIENVCSQDTF